MLTATLIVNNKAGRHLDGAGDNAADLLRDAGYQITQHPGSVDAQLSASRARPGDLIIVDGGDGTIRAAIAAHQGSGVPIAILPGGTMNLLAHDYGVPQDRMAAVDAILAGQTRKVDIGTINGEVFLHSAAMGLPARIGLHRERRRGRII